MSANLVLEKWGSLSESERIVSIEAESQDPPVIKVTYDVTEIQYIDAATVEATIEHHFSMVTALTSLKTIILETANPNLELTNAKLIQLVTSLSPEAQAEIAALPEFQAILANQ